MSNKIIFNPNALYYRMLEYLLTFKQACEKVGVRGKTPIIVNIGGMRSSKTFDAIHLICTLVTQQPNLTCVCYRQTLKLCRTVLFKEDFKRCLRVMNMHENVKLQGEDGDEPKIIFPNGSIIKFCGVPTDDTEPAISDIVYFNEVIDMDNKTFVEGAMSKCVGLCILDSNPKKSIHWIYEYEKRDLVLYTKTNYKNNKFLPESIVGNIESYCPWDMRDYKEVSPGIWAWTKTEEERYPNAENVRNKTINRWRWEVYGEGKRTPQEGAVFPDIEWVEKMPIGRYDYIGYGLDFGFSSDQTAIVRIGKIGTKICLKLLFYEPCNTPEKLYYRTAPILLAEENFLNACFVGREDEAGLYDSENKPILDIVCESQDKYLSTNFKSELERFFMANGKDNWWLEKVSKGTLNGMISNTQKFDITIEQCDDMETEFMNYTYKEVNGEVSSIIYEGTRGGNAHNHAIMAATYYLWKRFRFE